MPPSRGTPPAGPSDLRGGVRHDRRPYPNVEKVLEEMVRLANEYKSDPRVRDAVQAATDQADARSAQQVARSVWEGIRENVRYVRDPTHTELLQSPDLILRRPRYADCDGMAGLAAAMLSSIGIPSGFRAIAREEAGAYDHVYAVYKVGDGSERVGHFAVHARETGLNRELRTADYGDVLVFESALVLWNDDEDAYNLVVDDECLVDAIPAG